MGGEGGWTEGGREGDRERKREGFGGENERVVYEGKKRKGGGRRKASMPDFNKVLKFTLLSVF